MDFETKLLLLSTKIDNLANIFFSKLYNNWFIQTYFLLLTDEKITLISKNSILKTIEDDGVIDYFKYIDGAKEFIKDELPESDKQTCTYKRISLFGNTIYLIIKHNKEFQYKTSYIKLTLESQFSFFDYFNNALYSDLSENTIDYEGLCNQILQDSAIKIINSLENALGYNNSDIFFRMQELSQTNYETEAPKGTILFIKENTKRIEKTIEFKQDIPISNIRFVRKILQLSERGSNIICANSNITGIGKIKKNHYDIYDKNECFKVRIVEQGSWSVTKGKEKILTVINGKINLDEKLNEISIEPFLSKVFPNITNVLLNDITECIYTLIQQKKGAILVINNNVTSELSKSRLFGRSIPINPVKLTKDNIAKLSSIDGAIFTDEQFVCHAIGVIVDGIATGNIYDLSRGSRYNCSKCYYENRKAAGDQLVILVISDDGMINIFPE